MKRYFTNNRYRAKLLVRLLVTGLLFSSSFTGNAGNRVNEIAAQSGPTSFGSATIHSRNYALTTVPGQRTASDISKQNGIKRSVTDGGPALTESSAAAATTHQLLVTTDRTVSYLSFRLSRPGGRAPPISA